MTPELDRLIADRLRKGRYENASEVLRAALRSLERVEREFEARLEALRTAIDEGDTSGRARGNPFATVRSRLNLPDKVA